MLICIDVFGCLVVEFGCCLGCLCAILTFECYLLLTSLMCRCLCLVCLFDVWVFG